MSLEGIEPLPRSNRASQRGSNWGLLLTVVVMVALSAAQIVSYFMQWSHFYPPNGHPWPMADLADAQPYSPSNLLSGPFLDGKIYSLLFLLTTPVGYALCGLVGVLATKRLSKVVAVLSAIDATINLLLIAFLSSLPFLYDGSWAKSSDSGVWVAAVAALLMFVFAFVLLIQQDGWLV